MPIPKPKKGEKHDDFMDRCLGDDLMVKDYPDEKQRYAVCQKQWDDKDKQKKAEALEGMERRDVVIPLELREDGKTKKLTGYAAIFDSVTEINWFREQIAKGCFQETVAQDDIRGLFNHDPSLILGRNRAKTLVLKEDAKGLYFEIDVPDTQVGRDVVTSVHRGDVTGCSFAFRTLANEWDRTDPDHPLRTLTKVQLFDVGPVTYPAYVDTSVAARSLEIFQAEQQAASPENAPQEGQNGPDMPENEQKAAENQPTSGPQQPLLLTDAQRRDKHYAEFERQRDYRRKYEKLGRLMERNRPKAAS